MTTAERTECLKMPDEALARTCRITVARGSGRGGQKRNRTESAVRVCHEATGVSATCDQSRSQHTNRRLALRKLRLEIALCCRCAADPPYGGPWQPGRKSADYPLWVAWVLDVLDACDWRVADAARRLDLSTGRFVKDLATDPDMWQKVNAERERRGHPKLRA